MDTRWDLKQRTTVIYVNLKMTPHDLTIKIETTTILLT